MNNSEPQPRHSVRRLSVIHRHLVPSPSATPADTMALLSPQCTSLSSSLSSGNNRSSGADYLHLDDLLTEDERTLRYAIRDFMQTHVSRTDLMLDHVERQSFPLEELLPKLSRVCPAGSFLKGHGCPGQSLMAVSMAAMEMARVDASIATLFMVHSAIGMAAIGLCGSEEQKARYLPAMARYESISAFALTEPDVGSDASHLRTTATPTADRRGWVISGKKRWIGNASHSGAIVVWAMNTESGKVNGFIVERGTPGMTIEVIKNKIALRSVQNANITFQECVVDDAQRLPLAEDFRSGPGRVLFISRLFAAWLPVGIAAGCYDTALEYAKTRQQFGSPIARFQLVQAKLVKMLSHIQSMTYTAWRVTRLMEQGKCTHGMSSMVKANNTTLAREVAGMAREILGGNGIVRDYGVATHFCDLEAIHTYEGSWEINTLVTGREITGHNAFVPK